MLLDLELSGENGDSCNVPLKVGDRVVWISDTKPEQGIVRWLGHLDDRTLKNDLMAGVEFVSVDIVYFRLYDQIILKCHCNWYPFLKHEIMFTLSYFFCPWFCEAFLITADCSKPRII
jgi:hypothetical protein